MPKKTFSRGTRAGNPDRQRWAHLSPRVVIRTQGSLHFDRSRNQSKTGFKTCMRTKVYSNDFESDR